VSIGSTVELEADGRRVTFEIVGAQEANPMRGRISYLSPIGSSLIGHVAGDIVGVYRVIGVK
jgi:transcription elongation GreA/GreB family factor